MIVERPYKIGEDYCKPVFSNKRADIFEAKGKKILYLSWFSDVFAKIEANADGTLKVTELAGNKKNMRKRPS